VAEIFVGNTYLIFYIVMIILLCILFAFLIVTYIQYKKDIEKQEKLFECLLLYLKMKK